MSLRVNTIPLEAQIEAVAALLKKYGPRARRGGEDADVYAVLKAIHANLSARIQRPRSLPLGELERAMATAIRSKDEHCSRHYAPEDQAAIANVVIRHWPHMREALEWFAEETAE